MTYLKWNKLQLKAECCTACSAAVGSDTDVWAVLKKQTDYMWMSAKMPLKQQHNVICARWADDRLIPLKAQSVSPFFSSLIKPLGMVNRSFIPSVLTFYQLE